MRTVTSSHGEIQKGGATAASCNTDLSATWHEMIISFADARGSAVLNGNELHLANQSLWTFRGHSGGMHF